MAGAAKKGASRGCGSKAFLLFQPQPDLIVIRELATVRLRNAFADSGSEEGFFLRQAQRGVLHHILCV